VKYEFLEHTADIKFRARGKTIEDAFENVVLAISEVLGKGKKIKAANRKNIKIEGSDKENLLYNFIDELIYLLDAEGFVVSKGKVEIEGNKLKAVLFGDDVGKYKDLDHIKAATYAEMFVGKRKGGWEIVAVVDV